VPQDLTVNLFISKKPIFTHSSFNDSSFKNVYTLKLCFYSVRAEVDEPIQQYILIKTCKSTY